MQQFQHTQITLARPDDWHLHLRDDAALTYTVAWTATQFARAIVMPNLKPPVVNTAQALEYRHRILTARPKGSSFQPLMTLYLTDTTLPAEIERAKASGAVHAVKLYPAGATTNSASGVTDLDRAYPVFEAMQQHGMPLLIHGEVTDPEVDVFDREAVFIERHLLRIRHDFPALKIVLEHITTAQAASFVREQAAVDARGTPLLAATITAHHLLYSRNAMFSGGMRPHYYCLPVLKRERHRLALVAAATSGDARFFLGTDSAPHARALKEAACGCAGCLTAPHALELYAQAFEQAGALDRLEAFASHFGADFYGLPRNPGQITLRRVPQCIPEHLPYVGGDIVPLDAGQTLAWSLVA
ncbi:MAG: dihydroorotase [Burkholderiales bacterium]|jgi:dihydroorotase|nr:dihydroorotase [Burkholderiales bacterium]